MYRYTSALLNRMSNRFEDLDKLFVKDGKPENAAWIVVHYSNEQLLLTCTNTRDLVAFADSSAFKSKKDVEQYIFHRGNIEFSLLDDGRWIVNFNVNEWFEDFKGVYFDSCFDLMAAICCKFFLSDEEIQELIEQGLIEEC